MSLTSFQEFLWWIGISTIITFGAAYKFSCVIRHGIASARDEKHRDGPQSLWYFFDLSYRKQMPGFKIKLEFFLLLASVIIALPDFVLTSFSDPPRSVMLIFSSAAHLFFLSSLTISYFAGIMLWAPRFQSPMSCAFVCAIPGIVLGVVFFFLTRSIGLIILPIHLFVSCACYFLVRDYVRDKLGRDWFRFNE